MFTPVCRATSPVLMKPILDPVPRYRVKRSGSARQVEHQWRKANRCGFLTSDATADQIRPIPSGPHALDPCVVSPKVPDGHTSPALARPPSGYRVVLHRSIADASSTGASHLLGFCVRAVPD